MISERGGNEMKDKLLAAGTSGVLSIVMVLAVRTSLFASSACASPAINNPTTPMGTKDLTGGSTKLGEIVPSACPTDATGRVNNAIQPATNITDLRFATKNGTLDSVTVGSNTTNAGSDGTVNVDLSQAPMHQGDHLDYTANNVKHSGQGTANVELWATPSTQVLKDGVPSEADVLPPFQFDSMSDLQRNGIGQLYYPDVLGIVSNNDSSQHLTALAGTVSFPGSTSATLTGVRLTKGDGSAYSATISISGNDFTISSFSPVDPGTSCRIILTLDSSLNGDSMRLQLQGTFAP
jgi:hypothetical protein